MVVNVTKEKQYLGLKLVPESEKEISSWRTIIDDYHPSKRAPVDTNILRWRRDHENVYPTLAKMARDILCIQGYSVPVGRLFSVDSIVMNKRRTCLNNEPLKILMCINSWSKCSLKN